MSARFILSDYVHQTLDLDIYDKLEDSSFLGRIPPLRGVIAFGETLGECQNELQSTLEDWLSTGLKLGHPIPPIAAIDLNQPAA